MAQLFKVYIPNTPLPSLLVIPSSSFVFLHRSEHNMKLACFTVCFFQNIISLGAKNLSEFLTVMPAAPVRVFGIQ